MNQPAPIRRQTVGNWELCSVSGGRFALDGGAMFGVVPKPLWQRVTTADDRNRIPLQTNCLLARDGKHTVLVDTGYGGKLSDKERELNAAEPGTPLLENLAALGVSPEEIDLVVFSHLHFDHAGGGTVWEEGGTGRIVPAFPKATYVAQRREWEDATSGVPELRGSYPLKNLLPLQEAGCLRLIDGDEPIVPGLAAMVTGGHTAGHHALLFQSGGQTAAYLGDLCPTTAHLPTMWCMAYDVYPLDTRRRKPAVLGQAADENWLVCWDHDPLTPWSRILRDPQREFRAVDAG